MKSILRNILLLFLTLLTTPIFSQQSNIEIYSNFFGEIISKDKYKQYVKRLDYSKFIDISYVSNDSTFYKIVKRDKHGKLPHESLSLIKEFVETSKQHSLKLNELIIIDYHPGADECNETGSIGTDKDLTRKRVNKYQRDLAEVGNIIQLYVYKDKSGLKTYKGLCTWHEDKANLIENTFFKYHYSCGSFVVIDQNGNFYAYYGEYGPSSVYEAIIEMQN